MKRFMLAATALTSLCTAVFYSLYLNLGAGWSLTLGIVASTTCYHFAMRLCVGLLGCIPPARFDPDAVWWRKKSWEDKLYRVLRVHNWKRRMPTYDPAQFDLARGIRTVIGATCAAELVHTVIIPLSYLPLIVALIMGAGAADCIVFAVTGVLAGGVDLLFVVLQRYNRPRLVALAEQAERRAPDPDA